MSSLQGKFDHKQGIGTGSIECPEGYLISLEALGRFF